MSKPFKSAIPEFAKEEAISIVEDFGRDPNGLLVGAIAAAIVINKKNGMLRAVELIEKHASAANSIYSRHAISAMIEDIKKEAEAVMNPDEVTA